MPAMCHEKSSRNCHLCWIVVCGVFAFRPVETPFG